VTRDIAVVLPSDASFVDLVTALERVDSPVPTKFSAVDRYVGAPLAQGESSVTVRVILQPEATTLTEDEIESYRTALLAAVSDLGLKIRD